MASLVCIDTETGSLSRYECGGSTVRKTHFAIPNAGSSSLTVALIESFRSNPPDEFNLDPPPRPTNSPAGAGTIANDMTKAA